MINKLNEIRDLDDEIFDVFKKATLHLSDLLNKSEYPYTTEICFMFMSGTNFLKNSIFDCAENDDFYSVNVLFRSILEHFLRFQFFWFNNISYKDDSYALKFRTALDFKERLELERSLNSIRKIEKREQLKADYIWDNIREQNKNFKNFTKKEISEFSRNLSIKNVIHFIEETLKEGKLPTNDFLKKVIIKYSEMSSFVHGGLHAHKKMVEMEMDDNRKDKLIAICGLTLQAASFIKIFSYLEIYQFSKDFGSYYNETNELIKRLNNYR